MKVSIVSGGFDPVHVGHLELFQKARDLSDALWVIVNSDDFLTNKKGEPFMPFDERATILSNCKHRHRSNCLRYTENFKRKIPPKRISVLQWRRQNKR